LPDYLENDKGMSVGSTIAIQTAFGISCLCFSLWGGTVGQFLYAQDKKKFVLFLTL